MIRTPQNAMGAGSMASKRMPPRTRSARPRSSYQTDRMKKSSPAPAIPRKPH